MYIKVQYSIGHANGTVGHRRLRNSIHTGIGKLQQAAVRTRNSCLSLGGWDTHRDPSRSFSSTRPPSPAAIHLLMKTIIPVLYPPAYHSAFDLNCTIGRVSDHSGAARYLPDTGAGRYHIGSQIDYLHAQNLLLRSALHLLFPSHALLNVKPYASGWNPCLSASEHNGVVPWQLPSAHCLRYPAFVGPIAGMSST